MVDSAAASQIRAPIGGSGRADYEVEALLLPAVMVLFNTLQ